MHARLTEGKMTSIEIPLEFVRFALTMPDAAISRVLYISKCIRRALNTWPLFAVAFRVYDALLDKTVPDLSSTLVISFVFEVIISLNIKYEEFCSISLVITKCYETRRKRIPFKNRQL